MSLLLFDKTGPVRNWIRPKLSGAKRVWWSWLARRGRSRSKATFVGVTGSSGKSTATGLLQHILSAQASVQSQVLINTIRTLARTLSRVSRDTRYVVIEVGASGVNTVVPMAELLRPDVAIVTLVRLEHYTAFRKIELVAEEKGSLVEAVRPGGFAVLNADDEQVMSMASRTRERVVTFGMSPEADYTVSGPRAGYPDMLSFTLRTPSGELALNTLFPAVHFWVPIAAAVVAALELGIPAQTIVERVASFRPLSNRGEIYPVPGGPRFILDAAKAPWHSLNLAFEMIGKAKARRKRIVLGHISDYAGSSRKYGNAYQAARQVSDQVIFVGDNSHRSRASQEDRDSGRFREIRSVKEVADYIRETAVEDELVLIKGSANLHLERIALSHTHDVRCWVDACGKPGGCLQCGLYEKPFEEHSDFERRRSKLRKKRYRIQGKSGPTPS